MASGDTLVASEAEIEEGVMKFGKPVALGIGLLLGVAATGANADEPLPGLYFSMHGGVLWLQDTYAQIPTDDDNSVNEYGIGFRFGGALGYQLNNYVAVESEVSYGRAPLDWVTLYDNVIDPDIPIWSHPGSGSGAVLSFMGNIILGPQMGMVRPYVGFGGGMALVFSDTTSTNQDNEQVGPFADTDWAPTAQAFAGLEVAVSENVSIGGRYRIQWVGAFNLYEELIPQGFINVGSSIWQSVELTVKLAIGPN